MYGKTLLIGVGLFLSTITGYSQFTKKKPNYVYSSNVAKILEENVVDKTFKTRVYQLSLNNEENKGIMRDIGSYLSYYEDSPVYLFELNMYVKPTKTVMQTQDKYLFIRPLLHIFHIICDPSDDSDYWCRQNDIRFLGIRIRKGSSDQTEDYRAELIVKRTRYIRQEFWLKYEELVPNDEEFKHLYRYSRWDNGFRSEERRQFYYTTKGEKKYYD